MKQHTVSTQEGSSGIRKPQRGNNTGNQANIGNVGSIYQNVYQA
jgi:hypothetical protein